MDYSALSFFFVNLSNYLVRSNNYMLSYTMNTKNLFPSGNELGGPARGGSHVARLNFETSRVGVYYCLTSLSEIE